MIGWAALLAALGPALGKALYDVGKDVVIDPLLEPASEELNQRMLRGYRKRVDEAKLLEVGCNAGYAIPGGAPSARPGPLPAGVLSGAGNVSVSLSAGFSRREIGWDALPAALAQRSRWESVYVSV